MNDKKNELAIQNKFPPKKREFAINAPEKSVAQLLRQIEVSILTGQRDRALAAVNCAFDQWKVKRISLQSPIEELGLTPRMATILRSGGVFTVQQLISFSPTSLQAIHQIRFRSVWLIQEKLAEFGLKLRDQNSD